MSDAVEFIGTMSIVLLVWMAYSFRGYSLSEFKAYFASDTGKGILKGIVIAVGFTVALVLLTGCSGKYFNDAYVYAGLDHTKKLSPQCDPGGTDDRTTSNLGLKLNVYEYERFRTNAKYTHHSCAFNPDDRQYDAGGVEFEYKLWAR